MVRDDHPYLHSGRQTPLALATTYKVTIAAGAAAVSGRKLARPLTFTLTTPTARLLSTEWYRRGDRFDNTMVVALRFNQPVRPRDVLAHATARFSAHPWGLDDLEALRDRLRSSRQGNRRSIVRSKVAATRGVAASTGPVRSPWRPTGTRNGSPPLLTSSWSRR